MRLIFVPQYNTKMRYSEWWFTEFPKHFKLYFDDVYVLGEKYIHENIRGKDDMFSPIEEAIRFECHQIQEYNEMEIDEDYDILFLADLSFPGMFANILYHKKPKKCFTYCHATSLNKGDYFERVRDSKFPLEGAQASLFNKIFVGSYYHKYKLSWFNIEVVRLPPNPYLYDDKCIRIHDIISVCRPNPQKMDYSIENKINKDFRKIERKLSNCWDEYKEFLSSSNVLLITSKEDTFNYTIIDAIQCGCIPIAPNKLCFPEIIPREYLYDDYTELKDTLYLALHGELKVPQLLCQDQIDNFYKNISNLMINT